MGPPSYMRSVVDRNVVMRGIPVPLRVMYQTGARFNLSRFSYASERISGQNLYIWHGLRFGFIDPDWKVGENVGLNSTPTRTFITPVFSVYDPEETRRHTARWAWRRHEEEHNEMESQACKSIFALGFSDSTVTPPSISSESCQLPIHLLYRHTYPCLTL